MTTTLAPWDITEFEAMIMVPFSTIMAEEEHD